MDYFKPVNDDQVYPQTSLRIVEHIRFQKFRYEGENRPGKRKQHKEFMTLQIRNPQGTFVRVCVICVDADVQDKVKGHPNGLIGADCHHGLYDMRCPVPASEDIFTIVIPYIRIERIRYSKGSKQEIQDNMETRMSYLPSPYKEHFTTQLPGVASHKDVDTAKVRLAVIVSVEGCCDWLEKPLAVSNVIKDGSQDTFLDILKISCNHVPAASGAWVDIFTTDKSPPIKAGEFILYVTYQPPGASGKLERWVSEETCPGQDYILYNKVISYKVPPCEPNPFLKSPVKATLHLMCPESDLSCSCSFFYVPGRAATKFPTHSDERVMSNVRLIRKRSIKTCDTTCQVKSNKISFPETDSCSISCDIQKSNVKVRNGDNAESIHTIRLHRVTDTDDSKFTNNKWMAPTSVHCDQQKTRLPYMTTETQSGINMENYQATDSCKFGLSFSDYPVFSNTESGSFVQDLGVISRVRSISPGSVQQSEGSVAAITGCDARAGCSNSQQMMSKNSQCVPQSTAMQKNCPNALLSLKRLGEDMPQHFINYKYTASEALKNAQDGEEIVAPPHDSCKNGWKQTEKDIPDYMTDNQRPQTVSDWIKYFKYEQEETRFDTGNGILGQISDDFQDNRDCNETQSVHQTTPSATDNGNRNQISHNFQVSSDFSEATSVNQSVRFETDKMNFLQISDNFQANSNCNETKSVTETTRFAAGTGFTASFGAGDGNFEQILHHFQVNPGYSNASYASQTAPAATCEHVGTDSTMPTGLGTLDIFAEMADNLPTMNLSNLLNDIY